MHSRWPMAHMAPQSFHFDMRVTRRHHDHQNRSPTPTLALSLSCLKKFSGRHGLNQTIQQCINSNTTEPQPNLSGRSRAMTRNVASYRGFSLRPKFCFDAPQGKILLVRFLNTNEGIVSTSHMNFTIHRATPQGNEIRASEDPRAFLAR